MSALISNGNLYRDAVMMELRICEQFISELGYLLCLDVVKK